MNTPIFATADAIRTLFSRAMSEMYRTEVPQYGALLDLVADINAQAIDADKALAQRLRRSGEIGRLELERHGAIRLGTAAELSTMRRLFAVMGMSPVGYYDLSVAGVPVHATAFRAVDEESLRRNPFRVFTSLLRLELIEDAALRQRAANILARRQIFTPRCVELIERFETDGGLTEAGAQEFVAQALQTFRWHSEATVDLPSYRQLRANHPLIADVVCFKGPHINHLTPRVLDIDAAQTAMLACRIKAKAVVEGPPRRRWPILLRQTSFLALEEPIAFQGPAGSEGTHTARFGEIEQRGCALTPKGRQLYDELLSRARQEVPAGSDAANADNYMNALSRHFAAFPDDVGTLRRERLAYFRYAVNEDNAGLANRLDLAADVDALVDAGLLDFEPIVYEDFLPVSAAGIFQSNLGTEGAQSYSARAHRQAFEDALGASVHNEFELYRRAEAQSLDDCLRKLGIATNARFASTTGRCHS